MTLVELRDLNLSSERRSSLAKELQDYWRSALNARQSFDNLVAAVWERYECKPPNRTKAFAQASNIRVPLTQWTVDSILIRLMRTVFGQRPTFMVRDVDLHTAPDATNVERMLAHLCEVEIRLRDKMSDLFLNGLVEGTAIAKVTRTGDTRTIRDRVQDELREYAVTDGAGIGVEVIDLKDFVVANPAQPSIDRQPWVAHRVWLRWDDIVRRQRAGIYKITKDQLDKLKDAGKDRRTSEQTSLEQVKATTDKTEESGWGTFKEYEIIEVLAKYDWNGDDLDEECLFTIAVDWLDTPLRAESYPFWNGRRNYVAYRPIPRANRFYGQSAGWRMYPMQDELDAELNMTLDAGTFTILANMTPIISRAMEEQWRRHKWVLGNAIAVDAPENFRTLGELIKHPIQISQFNMDTLHGLAQRAGGVHDQTLGTPAPGSKTAYEIQTVQQEGNIRFSEMIENVQQSNQELSLQIVEHAYQLAVEDPEFQARITAIVGTDPFANVSMDSIRKRIAVVPTGNSVTANKQVEAQKWMALWQLLKDDPFVAQDLSKRHYLLMKVLTAAGAEQDAEEIIGSKAEIDAAKQLIAQKAAELQNAVASGQVPGMTMLGSGQPIDASATAGMGQ